MSVYHVKKIAPTECAIIREEFFEVNVLYKYIKNRLQLKLSVIDGRFELLAKIVK